MYEITEITYNEAQTMILNTVWEWICESTQGTTYWNSQTGELLWIDSDVDSAGYTRLKVSTPCK